MLKIALHTHDDPLYGRAHDFAKEKYLLPRMNMKLYYKPTVIFSAVDEHDSFAGVIGLNVGKVINGMLKDDPRTAPYLGGGEACDQAIFALDEHRVTLAPHVLCAAITVYARHQGSRYLGILAIPISRKIIERLGAKPLKCPTEQLGFGKPDINLIPPELRDNWKTWFEYNDPTSLEIVDLRQAYPGCRDYLKKFAEGKKISLSPDFEKIVYSEPAQ